MFKDGCKEVLSFYDILCDIIKRKIKDKSLLILLIGIIYSADGVPIGNYLSQFFANLYLAYFDHWVKEELKCKFYFRYADDIVILSSDKNFLRTVLIAIKMYLKEVKIKLPNIPSRCIDFVGYRFYHTHVLLRKSIKVRLFRLVRKYLSGKIDRQELRRRMQSYFGWLKFCNSKNLLRKIQRDTGSLIGTGRSLIFLDFITSIFMLWIWLAIVSVLELTLYTITNLITLRVGNYSTL